VKLTSNSNQHDDARSQAHSTISKGLAPSIAPGTQRVVNRALSMEARLENLKTALERASVLALDKMPKFDRLNLDRENRVIAASRKVLFDTATSYLRRRGDGKEKKVNEKYKPSELTLTKDEFSNLLNLYRPPGQMKLNEKEIKEVMDFCHNNVAELFEKVFNPTVQEVVVDQFGFTKDLKKADRPEYQTHPFDPKGSGVRVIKDRDVPSKDQVPKRIRYRFSRTAVQPPRDWDPKDIIRSAKLPEKKLELEYVMGFKDDNANTSMYATADGEIVYYTAAVAIVLNPVTKKQKFFLGHTDDISCIALHPSGGIVATGQVARKPFILVWNTRSMETINKVGHIPQSGPTYTSSLDPESTKKLYYDRGICSVAFSSCGKYLVAIGMDDYHSIAVWDWASDTMLAENQAQHGTAPQIFSCVASPPSWDANTGLFTFCTTGINHIKFWTFDKSAPEVKLTSKTGTYGRDCEKVPKETKSIAHIDNADSKLLLTGGDNGYIYMWDPKSHKLIKHWYAHKGAIWTLAAPSGLDTFFSGGDDGLVIQWDSAVLTPQEYNKTREINFSGRSREELTKMTNTMNAWKNERPVNFKPVDLPPPGQAPAPEISLEEPPPRLYAAVGSLFAFKGSLKERVAQREREKQYKLFPYPSLDDPAKVDSARKATSVIEDLLSVTLLVGTDHGDMLLFDGSTGNTEHIMKSHFGSLWGLSAHPTNSKVFATAGADQQLCIWNVETMSQIKKKQLTASARCVDISPDGRRVAVGFSNGAFVVYSTSGDMRPVAQQQHCREYLSVLRYSPNGDRLAVGSGDNFIDIYSTKQDLYTHLRRCKGHTSYITQLDWSVDGMIIQSNCGAYEINYWESSTGKQIRRTNDSIESDTDWASFTCTLGFPVMGIFPDASDGTDVNSLCLSHDGKYVVTADDFGSVKLFNAPCVVEDAPCFEYSGHSSHVMGARFLRNDKYVVSVGGNDCTIFIWRTEPIYETIGFDPLSKTEKWASTKLWK
jgi:WD40 repeat protein